MAQFDPRLRRETWLFQRVGTDPGDKPIYRRLGFNMVSYDNSPDRFIEPVSIGADGVNAISPSVTTIDTIAQEAGAIAGIEYFDARPFEVHSFGDPIGV
jgi:hypothetical protein